MTSPSMSCSEDTSSDPDTAPAKLFFKTHSPNLSAAGFSPPTDKPSPGPVLITQDETGADPAGKELLS